ncbi:MAG: hypothetical protein J6A30_03010 [Ruminococcus sp.]|nr:hypothetical protein [Ruminococcus sp.]
MIKLFILLFLQFLLCSCSSDSVNDHFSFYYAEYEDNDIRIYNTTVNESTGFTNEFVYALPNDNSLYDPVYLFPQYAYMNDLWLLSSPSETSPSYTHDMYDGISLRYMNYKLNPSNKEGIYLLSTEKESLKEIDLSEFSDIRLLSMSVDVLHTKMHVCFQNNTGIYILSTDISSDLTPPSITVLDDLLESAEIEEPLYPYHVKGYMNIYGSEQGFLFNEGANVYIISPETQEINLLFSEKDIINPLPYFDSYREGYNFIYDCFYQNGFYLISFPALNELPGQYIVIYTKDSVYYGYIKITESALSMYDKDNRLIEEITGNFFPRVFIRMQLSNNVPQSR